MIKNINKEYKDNSNVNSGQAKNKKPLIIRGFLRNV